MLQQTITDHNPELLSRLAGSATWYKITGGGDSAKKVDKAAGNCSLSLFDFQSHLPTQNLLTPFKA